MAFATCTRADGTKFQVVDAAKRGDLCYANRKGIFWHNLDKDSGIDAASIKGPFGSADEAKEAGFKHARS